MPEKFSRRGFWEEGKKTGVALQHHILSSNYNYYVATMSATIEDEPEKKVCTFCCGGIQPLTRVYVYLIVIQVVLFSETGALPALLVSMTEDFKLTFAEQGYLGGIVYLGIALGAPFTSLLTKWMMPRTVLVSSISLNTICVFLFAFCPQGNTKYLITLRFLIGVTQATVSVFSPIWVDRFAPKDSQTKWFSYLQISIPAAILVGYILGWGAVGWQDFADPKYGCAGIACWRLPFLFQAVLTVPLLIMLQTLNADLFDIENNTTHNLEGNDSDQSIDNEIDAINNTNNNTCCDPMVQYFKDIYRIMSHFYFTITILLITCVYFMLMAIQYWATDYMIVGRKYNEHQVMGWFIFSCATAPIISTIIGGRYIDWIGKF